MALPSSPPINYLQILAEFGAPAGTPITSMVRGGTYVPNTATNAGVPTAPPIDVLDFLGASAVDPLITSVTDATPSGSEFRSEPAPPTVSVTTNSTTASMAGGSGGADSYLWEYVSGSTAFGTSPSTNPTKSWTATVGKNVSVQAIWRVTGTRGAESDSQDVTVTAAYHTDL